MAILGDNEGFQPPECHITVCHTYLIPVQGVPTSFDKFELSYLSFDEITVSSVSYSSAWGEGMFKQIPDSASVRISQFPR